MATADPLDMLLAASLSLCLFLAALLALRRVTVRASFRGGASEATGFAAAGGAQMGPFAVTVAVHDAETAWAIHVMGRQVGRRRTERTATARQGRLARWRRRMRTSDLLEFVEKAFGRVRFENVHARVRCGSTDPLLTGRVAGALAVASAVLAPVARIESELDWTAEADSLELQGDLSATFVPVLLAWDVVCFAAVAGAAAARDTAKQRRMVNAP